MANEIFTKKTDIRNLASNIWANTFHITDYTDSAGNTNEISNIFNSLVARGDFLEDYGSYEIYEIAQKDTWENISFSFYDTVDLWWIVCQANKIQDPFSKLVKGTKIKILKATIVDEILYQIEKERML